MFCSCERQGVGGGGQAKVDKLGLGGGVKTTEEIILNVLKETKMISSIRH